ncbi:3063_t:CDS:2, partial [Racocetra persica]
EIMNGYLIPKNTPVWIPIYAIHHDPLIWGDDAEYFGRLEYAGNRRNLAILARI